MDVNVNHDPFDAYEPANPPGDRLEQALRQMLEQRSADVTEPSRLRVEIDADRDADPASPLPFDTGSDHRPPGGRLGSLLAAAAVLVVGAGTAVAVHSLSTGHRPAASRPSPLEPAPTATPTPRPSASNDQASCPLPASWQAAITAGTIKVDQPNNQPLSPGADGSILMLQTASGQVGAQTHFTHQELAIFDRGGHGATIWQAADPAHDYVDVSPDSAVSDGWVVFGLTRSQNLAAHGVAAWNRATGQLSTVRLQTAVQQAANQVIDFDPIVVGDTAYWVEQKFNDSVHQQLVAQPLPAGTRTSQPVSRVSRLIAVGGGVALVHQPGAFVPGTEQGYDETLTAGPGLRLPGQVTSAFGTYFDTDQGVLRWLDHGALLSWRPGQQSVQRLPLPSLPLGAHPVGPFLVGDTAVLDTRNGALIQVSPKLGLALASGSDLLVTAGTTKFGTSSVHRVPLTSLAPVRC